MAKRFIVTIVILVAITWLPGPSRSQYQNLGIMDKKAPAWDLTDWYNLPEDVDQIELSDFDGKVVYLFGFQSWCPGCHSHGFPTMKTVKEHYTKNDNVVFVAVQTVFEGQSVNTSAKAKKTLDEFDLDIPVAHDAGPKNSGSVLMRKYRSGGTPWTIIIDRDGFVRFNGFRIQPKRAVQLIDRLLAVNVEG